MTMERVHGRHASSTLYSQCLCEVFWNSEKSISTQDLKLWDRYKCDLHPEPADLTSHYMLLPCGLMTNVLFDWPSFFKFLCWQRDIKQFRQWTLAKSRGCPFTRGETQFWPIDLLSTYLWPTNLHFQSEVIFLHRIWSFRYHELWMRVCICAGWCRVQIWNTPSFINYKCTDNISASFQFV